MVEPTQLEQVVDVGRTPVNPVANVVRTDHPPFTASRKAATLVAGVEVAPEPAGWTPPGPPDPDDRPVDPRHDPRHLGVTGDPAGGLGGKARTSVEFAALTFVGGEVGIEDAVRRVNRIRAERPAFGRGTSDPDAVDAGDDRVYAVIRRHGGETGLLLVNLSDAPVRIAPSLPPAAGIPDGPALVTPDLLGGPVVEWGPRTGGGWTAAFELPAWGAVALPLADAGR